MCTRVHQGFRRSIETPPQHAFNLSTNHFHIKICIYRNIIVMKLRYSQLLKSDLRFLVKLCSNEILLYTKVGIVYVERSKSRSLSQLVILSPPSSVLTLGSLSVFLLSSLTIDFPPLNSQQYLYPNMI